MVDSPAPFAQGSSSITDVVSVLQGITRQIQSGNTQLAAIVLALLGVNLKGYTVGTLPSSPSLGNLAYVTDGTAALAWGATLTGGGGASTFYICAWNGIHWTVMGK